MTFTLSVLDQSLTRSADQAAREVLLAALGGATNTIRIGSGGIMLRHYSAYKIAEVFSLLTTA